MRAAGRRRALLGLFAAGLGAACRDAALPAPVASHSAPHYVDVAGAKGLRTVTYCGSPSKDHLLESIGSGGAFVDVDGDGDDDIVVLSGWRLEDTGPDGGPRRVIARGGFGFYRNEGGGSFTDDTQRSGLGGGEAWATGVAAGDIDGDGDLDLHVTCFGPDLLYRNRGDGTFEEVAASAGVADPAWGGGSAFLDADGDGDLDLYVANYIDATMPQVLEARRTLVYKGRVEVMVGPFGMPGSPDRFYRNRGDGTFDEASAESGLEDRAQSYGLGVLAADLDDDGDVDLYVANDSNPNFLFQNDGHGQFHEMGVISGAGLDAKGAAQAGMGVNALDADGDGTLDIVVTNFADDATTLYAGEGKLFYRDVARERGIAEPTYRPLSWGVVPTDVDQDGLPDLIIANGQIYPQVDGLTDMLPYRQPMLVLRNAGSRFEDVTARSGPGARIVGSFRGLAAGDLEGDGDEDLLLTRIDETPLLLEQQGGDPRRMLVVAPSRPLPGWMAARVDVTAGGRTQSRVILSGGSFASQSSLRAAFAVGDGGRAERVVVRFPGGTRQEFSDVPAGKVLLVDPPRPR
ncbi:MAG: CRTAC1 family protein [Acidobacteriota bacterium]